MRFQRFLLAFLSVSVLGAAIVEAQVPQVLYYRMNEGQGATTRNDAVPGGGNPSVTLTGTTQWTTPGKLGPAHLDFAPSGLPTGMIQSGWATDLTQDWTFEYWFTPHTSYPASNAVMYMTGDSSASSFRVFCGGVAYQGIYVRTGSPDLVIPTTYNVYVAGQWTHFAVVHDLAAQTLTGYINGAQAAQVTLTSPLTQRGSDYKIGGYSTSSSWNGEIDEFRFWNVARTQAEIQAYMNIEIGTGFEVFGSGCAGSGGFVPTLYPNGVPQLGSSFDVVAGNLNGGALSIAFLGLSDSLWIGGIQLPLDLGLIGAPGCALLCSTEVILGTSFASGAGPGTGSASVTIPIPTSPFLQGAVGFAGYLIVDPVNSLGLINTPAARITVQ